MVKIFLKLSINKYLKAPFNPLIKNYRLESLNAIPCLRVGGVNV